MKNLEAQVNVVDKSKKPELSTASVDQKELEKYLEEVLGTENENTPKHD